MTADDEARAHAIAGRQAAIEYARVMHGILTTLPEGPPSLGQIRQLASNQTALDFIRDDCAEARPPLDLLGALAMITVRAAALATSVVDGMTVPKFLDLLEAESNGWGRPAD